MKTYACIPLLFVLLVLATSQLVSANDTKFLEAMARQLNTLDAAQSIDDLQQSANAFERIGNAEKVRWEPFYYAAYSYVMMANVEKEGTKKDIYLDKAETFVGKVKPLKHNQSEVTALEGFIVMMRVAVDPGSRGQTYAPKAMQLLEHAVKLNADNPRAIALLAQMQYGTAKFFGSSTMEACALVDRALAKFNAEADTDTISPHWGKSMAESLKATCK